MACRCAGSADFVAPRCSVGALVPAPTVVKRFGGGVPHSPVCLGYVAFGVAGTFVGDLATQVGAHIVRYAGRVCASPMAFPAHGLLGGLLLAGDAILGLMSA
jgi:hypothetical protein